MKSRLILSIAVSMLCLPLQTGRCRTKPVGWWVFDREHVRQRVRDLAGGNDATMDVTSNFTKEVPHALVLDQTSPLMTIPGVDASKLPKRNLTADAWIALDAGSRWGGIIGYLQGMAVGLRQ